MLFSLILFALLLPGIYILGRPLFGLSPQAFGYVLMALFGIPVSTIFVVPGAIVAAVSDLEERLSGAAPRAMHLAHRASSWKLALGLSTVITGGLWTTSAKPWRSPRHPATGPVAALFTIIGAVIFFLLS